MYVYEQAESCFAFGLHSAGIHNLQFRSKQNKTNKILLANKIYFTMFKKYRLHWNVDYAKKYEKYVHAE